MISSGADYITKIWDVQTALKSEGGESDTKVSVRLIAELIHPSFVYSGKIIPYDSPDKLQVITACYDGQVRFWSVEIHKGHGGFIAPTNYEKFQIPQNDEENHTWSTKKNTKYDSAAYELRSLQTIYPNVIQ